MTIRTMHETLARVAVIGMAALGCATAGRETAHDQTPTAIQSPAASVAFDASNAPLPSRTSDVLTLAEISGVPTGATAYDAVERLRPWFLSTRDARGATNPSGRARPAVFVNGVFNGETDLLRAIPVTELVEVRLVRSLDAVHRYGPDYQTGVILVRLR